LTQVQAKARVGAKELTAMLTVLVSSQVFLTYPRYVSASGIEAAWMEPILSGVISLVIFLFVDRMFSGRFIGMNIVDVSRLAFGRFGAVVIALTFSLFFLLLTANTMRQFTENVIATVLPTTPILVVSFLFIVTIGYVAHCGLEGVARISYIALPVAIIGIVALCLLTVNSWKPSYLFPYWGAGLQAIGIGSLRSSSVFVNVLLLCIIYPHANDPKALRQVGVVSTLLAVGMLTGFIVCYHMVFTPAETTQLASPMYSMARLIHVGRFVQRLESVFIFMWVSAAVVRMALTLWVSAYLLASAFAWPTYRPILPALGLICISASLLPNDVASVFIMDQEYVMRWSWILLFIVPVFILWAGMMRTAGRRRPRGRRGRRLDRA
jgi:spore germination protein KB